MIVLGIDSSTDKLGVGLSDDSRILAEKLLESAQEHASHIMGMIADVLAASSRSKTDLDGIAVALGPGSFTGLRIGLAVAKGLAVGLGIPLVGVSTFEVIAGRLQEKYETFYLTASVRKGELYLCRVERGVDIQDAIRLIDQKDLADAVGPDPVGVVGRLPDGWPGSVTCQIPSEELRISGGELAAHGARLLALGKSDPVADLEPLYIAPSQAERKFGRR